MKYMKWVRCLLVTLCVLMLGMQPRIEVLADTSVDTVTVLSSESPADAFKKRFEERERNNEIKELNGHKESSKGDEEKTDIEDERTPLSNTSGEKLSQIEQFGWLFVIGSIILGIKQWWKKKYIEVYLDNI